MSQEPLGPLGTKCKNHYFWHKCCLFLDHFHSVSFWHTQKKPCSIYLPISGPPRSSWDIMVAQAVFCRSLIKVKFFIDQVRPALGSVGWLSPCSKSLKIALFQTFSSWHPNTFYPTALYWPGTAFYWLSTTKYQLVPASTAQYHHIATSTAPLLPALLLPTFLLLAFLHPARPTSSFPTSSLSYFKLFLLLSHPTSSFSYF